MNRTDDYCVTRNKYNLIKVDKQGNEVPIILKTRPGIFLETQNPKFKKTDNIYLRLNFIFNNDKDAQNFYCGLKDNPLNFVERDTGYINEVQELNPQLRYPDGEPMYHMRNFRSFKYDVN